MATLLDTIPNIAECDTLPKKCDSPDPRRGKPVLQGGEERGADQTLRGFRKSFRNGRTQGAFFYREAVESAPLPVARRKDEKRKPSCGLRGRMCDMAKKKKSKIGSSKDGEKRKRTPSFVVTLQPCDSRSTRRIINLCPERTQNG